MISDLVQEVLLWFSTIACGVVFGILATTEYLKRHDQPPPEVGEGQEAQIIQFPTKKAS